MKKFFIIMLLTLIGCSVKIMGQTSCQNAQPLTFNDSLKNIYIESSEYWLYFIADTNKFKLNILPVSQFPLANISIISLYVDSAYGCNNLLLKEQINLLNNDSILDFQTLKGHKYYIKINKEDSIGGYFTFNNSNKIGSPSIISCAPKQCQINPNGDISAANLHQNLIDALSTNTPTQTQISIITNPLENLSNDFSSCCNWISYSETPQVFREGFSPNYNYYLYMWAINRAFPFLNGNEAAYNLISGITVPNGVGLTSGNVYNVSLKYRVHFPQNFPPYTQGIDGLLVRLYNNQTSQLLTIQDLPLTNSVLNQWINFSFVFTCNNANFNSILINPYCNTSTTINKYGGIDIDDVVITKVENVVKPIIVGNPNNCNTITNYSLSNPQNCVNYNWIISPNYAGSIISGQGTANITVEWKNLTACENTLSVTASSPGTSSISTVMNIYSCCTTFPTQLNNVSNLTTSYANQRINVNGNLYIAGNVTFSNCDVYLSPYSKIIVEPGANLSLINGTLLSNNRCCDIMWDGIYLSSSNSTLTANSPSGGSVYTTIENSINGIVATNNTNLNIVGVRFNNNASSMSIKNYLPLISNIQIHFNHFEGGPLKNPYLGGYSRYGIQIDNADNIPIGNSTTGGAGNYFNNLFCGIYGLNSYMKINSNHFTNIDDFSSVPYQCQSLTNPLLVCKPTAIHSAHTFTNNQTFINAPKKVEIGYTNTFDNCINGIKVYNEKAIISSNIVRAVTNAIDVLDPLNYSEINNNIVENCSNGIFPYKGIQVWKTQPALINLSVYSNNVKSRYTGICG